jgi:hypothetical protein
MKVYVIMRRKDRLITSLHECHMSVEKIKALIDKWDDKKDHFPEIIEDEKALEIVEFFTRNDSINLIGFCQTCNKNEFCNPRRNYGITAIKCKKYIERKIKKGEPQCQEKDHKNLETNLKKIPDFS